RLVGAWIRRGRWTAEDLMCAIHARSGESMSRVEVAWSGLLIGRLAGGSLVGEGVALLESLVSLQGERPWDAEVMWYLDDALARLGRGSVEDAGGSKRIEEARERILGHPELGERPEAGESGITWCVVDGERLRFRMGSPEDEDEREPPEGPVHEVCIAEAYAIAATPVTNAQYRRFRTGHQFPRE